MEFVPPALRVEQVPCRFVELAPDGVTVDFLYRCSTPEESEDTLRHWLRKRIRELEEEVSAAEQFASRPGV